MNGKTDSLTVKIILRFMAVLGLCLMMFWADFSRPIIVIVGCIFVFVLVSFGLVFTKKLEETKPSWWYFVAYSTLIVDCCVGALAAILVITDAGPSMKIEERAKYAEEHQLKFGMNAWFELADEPKPATNNWWIGTVRQQRPLVAGIYQVKVLRDSDNTIFLTLASRELAEGEKVEVGMFSHKAWQGSFGGFTHIVR